MLVLVVQRLDQLLAHVTVLVGPVVVVVVVLVVVVVVVVVVVAGATYQPYCSCGTLNSLDSGHALNCSYSVEAHLLNYYYYIHHIGYSCSYHPVGGKHSGS
jgi:hypothetical protein